MKPFRTKLAFAAAAGSLALCAVAGQAQDRPTLRTDGTIVAMPPIAESSVAITPDKYEAYVERLEATEAVKRLIASFGYYRSANLPAETVALFTQDGRVDYDGGQWVGHPALTRLFEGRFRQAALAGTRGPQANVLNESYVLQPVIDVAADNRSASARFREIHYLGKRGESQLYGAMLYEAVFTRNDRGWAIRSLVPCLAWQTDYHEDLSKAKLPDYPKAAPVLYPEAADGPDRLSSQLCTPWPFGGITPPMHYPHPVTGEYINKP
ncbi:MAG TPA: nuclear transport factor 2 family protein [Sphingobium sp.]|nr:nuclear transport factor 2 family protein [Sphingobium sp.]